MKETHEQLVVCGAGMVVYRADFGAGDTLMMSPRLEMVP